MSENIYVKENVPVFEALYGEGLISLGGKKAILKMFEEENLKEKKLLDIGFGLGGMAFFLAETFRATVLGLELHPWMAEFAKKRCPGALKDKTNFFTYGERGSIPCQDESIDLAYSKGVLTNIEDKEFLFKEVARVLKPGGRLCLIDWLSPKGDKTQIETLSLGPKLFRESPEAYKEILDLSGFEDLIFEDVTEEYLGYAEDMLAQMQSEDHKKKFASVISEDLRRDLIDFDKRLVEQIRRKEKLSYRIRGKKKTY